MPVEITVRGHQQAAVPAELGTVHAGVHRSSGSAAEVMAAVSEAAQQLHDGLAALHDPEAGPVVRWSGDQLHTWLEQHDEFGERRRKGAHHARAGVRATFSDAAAVGRWLAESAEVGGFEVGRTVWELTPATRAEVERDVRREAVHDAVRRAQDYADAAGLGTVELVSLADGGRWHDEEDWEDEPVAFAQAASSRGSVPVSARDVMVRASVKARFVVA